MLIRRAIVGDVERLIIDDSQAVLVLERDARSARVLSWSDRRDERPGAVLEPIAAGCDAACPHASKSARPSAVELTIDRHRQIVHWWSMVLRVMSMRPEICARCSLLTRWSWLYWCGVPAPVRAWRRVASWLGWIASIATGGNVGGVGGDVAGVAKAAGCGCCLNVKWRLLETPRSMMRRLAALLLLALTGERVELETAEVACPYGLWPSAL